MNNKNSTAIIPGTFDPPTNGHLDIIRRASKLFDKIYVVLFENSEKKSKTMFSLDERLEMLVLACGSIGGNNGNKIEIDVSGGLLVDYAKEKGAEFIVKGVRNIIDFEYERDMSMMNRVMSGDGDIETLFFPAKTEHLYISSRFVRDMILYNKDISGCVPEKVCGFIKGLKV